MQYEIRPTVSILPQQLPLCPALPTVIGNVDYQHFEELLRRIDELLILSGMEDQFVCLSVEDFEHHSCETGALPTVEAVLKHQKRSRQALRCMVLKELLNCSYRVLSRRLAECALFRVFCQIEELAVVRVPGKSTLQEYAHWLPEAQMRAVHECLIQAAANPMEVTPLQLANALELEMVWMDTTCLKANIHFPVDWVLLRDAARTLTKAVSLIRRHGLKHRIAEPESFLSQMNALAIAMTQSRRKRDSGWTRKKVLRAMKRLLKVIKGHACRYRQMLDERWQETDWTRAQAEVVLRRIDGVLEQLPAAIAQAHERIIGGRQVPSHEKILSLYESDLHVIVRGKADAEVEFGNSLLIAEQSDGVIVDYELLRDASPGDANWLGRSLERLEALRGEPVFGVAADRGFDSAANRRLLEEKEIFNALCPRDPRALQERMEDDEIFGACQKRRAQSEGRIGVLKNSFLGRPLRAKGFERRQLAVSWAVLAHNLWVLARLPKCKAAGQSPPGERRAA